MAAAALRLLAIAALAAGAAVDAAPVAVWTPGAGASATFKRVRDALCAAAPCVDASTLGVALAQHKLQAGAYGGLLVENTDTARMLADFAAASGTPVIRVAAAVADVHPAFERPAAIVVPDDSGLRDNDPHHHAMWWETRRFAAADWAAADLGPALLAAAASGPPPAFTCTVPSNAGKLLNHPLPDDARSAPLGLAMIVKNEAGTIAATLDAARPHVDGWTLLDTGSTDGTAGAAQRSVLAQTLPGTVESADFGDFARARNLALQTHGQRTAYTLMPDADFGFVGLWRLRAMAWRLERSCARACAPICASALKVVRRTPGVDVNMVVMFPSHAQGTLDGWHYRYPVHEVATLGRSHGGDSIDVPAYARLEPLPGADPSAKSPARWRDFDLPTLREASLRDPNDTRIAFYLARTLQAVELDDEALDAYARRADMGGWFQEVFFSHYERGRLLAAKPDGDPTDAFLAAAAVDPERAEPYAALAAWHDDKVRDCPGGAGPRHKACKLQHRAAGYVYAKEAAARTGALPTGKLFFITSVYDWGADLQVSLHGYWLAEGAGDACAAGHATAKKLAAKFPGKHPYNANIEFFKTLSEKLDKVSCSL